MRRAPGAEPSSGAATRLPGYFPGLQTGGCGRGPCERREGRAGGAGRGLTRPAPRGRFSSPAGDPCLGCLILAELATARGRESPGRPEAPGKDEERGRAGPAMPPAAAVPAGDRAPAASGAQLDPGEARL